jgi:hypothetical protein
MLIPRRLIGWSTHDVDEWLDHNNMQELRKYFQKHKINGRRLLTLSKSDITSMSSDEYIIKKLKKLLRQQWDMVFIEKD